jgi:DNA-binding NarL/FixJ family response regulator
VLVDAELPGDAAIATIRQLRACLPSARVVALALYAEHRAATLAAGAHAFVLKDAGFEALHAAIVPKRATESTSGAACESASARTPWSART